MTSLLTFSTELLFKAPEATLVAWAEAANDAYNNSISGSIISDEEWDQLVDAIAERFPHRKNWLESIKVVDCPDTSTADVGPHYPMTSLSKVRTDKELQAFMNGCKSDELFLVQDKFDGLSIQLVQTRSRGTKMFTRRHPIGQDISFLVPLFTNTSSGLCTDSDIFAVRGELILPKSGLRIIREMYDPDAVNCRNTLAGAMASLINCHRSKSLPAEKDLHILALSQLWLYEVLYPSVWTYQKQHEQAGLAINEGSSSSTDGLAATLSLIYGRGIDLGGYPKVAKLPSMTRSHAVGSATLFRKDQVNVEFLTKYLLQRQQSQPYDMDGLTVKYANRPRDLSQMLSGKWRDPKNAVAFKVATKGIRTKVLGVEWNISKLGRIKPTVILEPVQIGQVTADRATAHNAKFIYVNCVGKGAIAELIHAGDVIPKVVGVPVPAKKPDMPTNFKWKWNASQVEIEIDENSNETQQLQLVKQLVYLAATFEMKHTGESILESIVKGIPITSIEQFFRLDESIIKSVSIKGIGQAKWNTLLSNISKLNPFLFIAEWDKFDFEQKQQLFAKLMSTSGKFGAGCGIDICLNIIMKSAQPPPWNKESLQSLEMIGPGRAEQFSSGWPEFESWLINGLKMNWPHVKDSLWPVGGKVPKPSPATKYNIKVVLSGFRDNHFAATLSNEVVSVQAANSVTRSTALLVIADDTDRTKPTGKLKDAEHLKVAVVTRTEAKSWVDSVYIANATCVHGCDCKKDCENCGSCNERELFGMKIIGWK